MKCKECNGSGKANEVENCDTCEGSGIIETTQEQTDYLEVTDNPNYTK